MVVCNDVSNFLLPIFSNFTVIRLNKGDAPPPWNATAFLFNENGRCSDHPYVKESMERRKRSPYLVAPDLSPTNTSELRHGVRWLDFSINSTNYLRVIHERPAILNLFGEVFWRKYYKIGGCSDYDFILYREWETLIPGCLTIHFLQGLTSTVIRGAEDRFNLDYATKIYQKTTAHPYKPVKAVDYEKFCSIIIRFESAHPVHMFNSTRYDADAIVRHVFFRQLSEYKPCERITTCPGGIANNTRAFGCMVGYKFHITMENTSVDGYVSEKLLNGALGGGIPIYFGARDIGSYVNPKSFVHCQVSREVIEEMRSFYPRIDRDHPRPFLFKNFTSWPTDDELLSWSDSYLRPQLEPCVKRVIELDKNDDDYMEMLNEPFVLRKDIMNGIYPLRGVALAYNLLSSRESRDFAMLGSTRDTKEV
eukprot:CAMPEP_0183738368 /NCGR_PEP_ID=MMETSP0737-20130205/54361_1 /TAXON_ID=385413 /ORGANISM="Thalassiosira miniscula, Strain CCMP1093" /LENGTH=420 /DNA_ID=CAMNT_0025972887 /DNA_START=272 /DNA_END=1534 /DNA_ORIENTATION=+